MSLETLPELRRYLPTGDTCFVCGGKYPRGLHLRFFTCSDRQDQAEWTPEESLTGYEGVVHGGIIGTVLDNISGQFMGLR